MSMKYCSDLKKKKKNILASCLKQDQYVWVRLVKHTKHKTL